MNKIIRQSDQFELNDKRLETCPRYGITGPRVTNVVTYFTMQVLEVLRHDLAECDLALDDEVVIRLSVIDDGLGIVHMVKGRMTIDKKASP